MLYLASRSPRRRQLLAQLGLAFEVVDVEVPEVRAVAEPPGAYVARVARAKARAGLDVVAAHDPDALVVAGDTEVVLEDRVFGKPGDAVQAAAMLEALSGRVHEVLSAVCVARAARLETLLCVSTVTFARLEAAAVARYVATGEPFGKAGGYAIQGRAAQFVMHLCGSYSGVMGLPLYETACLLARFGAGG